MKKNFKNQGYETKPYVISGKNNVLAYSSLLFGLKMNDLEIVKKAVSAGANIEKVKVYSQSMSEWENDSYLASDMIPLIEHVVAYSDDKIRNYINSISKMTPERENSFMLKEIHECIDEEQTLLKLKKIVSSKNINKLHKMVSLTQPDSVGQYYISEKNMQATFLHAACAHGLVRIAKWLLEQGADPNLPYLHREKPDGACAMICATSIPLKGDQSKWMSLALLLLKNKADFYKDYNNQGNPWSTAVYRFKIPVLNTIFKDYAPKSILTMNGVLKKSAPLYKKYYVTSPNLNRMEMFSKYPLLKDMVKYEDAEIFVDEEMLTEGVQSVFRNKSLKKTMQSRYNLSSSSFMNTVTNNFIRNGQWGEGSISFDTRFILWLDLLKELFLTENNHSDFVDMAAKYTRENYIPDWVDYSSKEECDVLVSLLKDNFTAAQIKKILMSYDDEDMDNSELEDLVAMYSEHPKELSKMMKDKPFHQLDSLMKLHDFVAGENETLNQSDFEIDQVKHKPALKKIETVSLPDSYSLKLASSNHELIRWGSSMGHCIGGGGYARDANNGETILMALNVESEPKYALEISPKGDILQVQGKSHTTPPLKIMKAVVDELKKIKVLNRYQKAAEWSE